MSGEEHQADDLQAADDAVNAGAETGSDAD